LALLVYAPSLAGGFLYDDVPLVLHNRHIQDLREIRTVLNYEPARPLLNVSWAVNYALSGTAAWSYHLVNVSIHAVNCALVTSLLRWIAGRRGLARPRETALLGGCLFATTPMAAETVAYVASRSSALVSLFSLASLRVTVAALEGSAPRRLTLGLGLFLLALATKEEAASVPLFLLLIDYFFVASQAVAEVLGRRRVHAAFLALPIAGLAARRTLTGQWLPAPAIEVPRYLLTQWTAFPLYLLRHLVPLDPAFYRHVAPAAWPLSLATLTWGLVALAAFGSAIAWRARWPLWSFAVGWLAAGLLPSSSLVALNEMVVDHRAYLGGVGLMFLLASWMASVARWRLALAWLAVCAVVAVRYQWVLGDPVRAWEDAVQRAPGSAEAFRALAEAYAARGDPKAEAALRGAVRLDPGDSASWVNLGTFYAQRGRLDDALSATRSAVAASPDDARIRNNLGLILRALGRVAEAERELEAAVSADARLAQPRINLAELLLQRGEYQRARGLLEEAARLEIDPQEAEEIGRLRQRIP
jgi:hypothetical protein